MPRKAIGDRPMTGAERQARQRAKHEERTEALRLALEQIATAKTVREAREIAAEAIGVLTHRA
jgi:hypothetical protein